MALIWDYMEKLANQNKLKRNKNNETKTRPRTEQASPSARSSELSHSGAAPHSSVAGLWLIWLSQSDLLAGTCSTTSPSSCFCYCSGCSSISSCFLFLLVLVLVVLLLVVVTVSVVGVTEVLVEAIQKNVVFCCSLSIYTVVCCHVVPLRDLIVIFVDSTCSVWFVGRSFIVVASINMWLWSCCKHYQITIGVGTIFEVVRQKKNTGQHLHLYCNILQ